MLSMTHNAFPRQSDSSLTSQSSSVVPPHEYSCAAETIETTRVEGGFLVVAATLADLPRIVAIDGVSFSQPWSPRTFEDALRDDKSLVLVARNVEGKSVDGQACAFGVASVVGDEAEIATLAVAIEARGRGLGEHLLRELMRLCIDRGARRLFLEVRPSNQKARALYERLGYSECGRRRNYYADGEDALILRADCSVSA